jgi:hypothetical protein
MISYISAGTGRFLLVEGEVVFDPTESAVWDLAVKTHDLGKNGRGWQLAKGVKR